MHLRRKIMPQQKTKARSRFDPGRRRFDGELWCGFGLRASTRCGNIASILCDRQAEAEFA
jgi:hypothetical protein